MVLLDASALVALLRDEPAADAVERILREGSSAITAVNLAEAMDVVCRRAKARPAAVRSALGTLESTLTVVPVDPDMALRAGELRASHYDRQHRPVSIPDCILVSAAREGDSVASSDAATLAVANLEGVPTVPLPDSAGRMPR